MADGRIQLVGGRLEVWVSDPHPGGYVCAEPNPNVRGGICRMPVEDVPCTIHHPGRED